jgi:hypothetical protein
MQPESVLLFFIEPEESCRMCLMNFVMANPEKTYCWGANHDCKDNACNGEYLYRVFSKLGRSL